MSDVTFTPELLTFVQNKIADRMQQLMAAIQVLPQDDYTIVAMGTMVINRLMTHLMHIEMTALVKEELSKMDTPVPPVPEGNRFEA